MKPLDYNCRVYMVLNKDMQELKFLQCKEAQRNSLSIQEQGLQDMGSGQTPYPFQGWYGYVGVPRLLPSFSYRKCSGESSETCVEEQP